MVLVLDDDPTTVPAIRAGLVGQGDVRVEPASRAAMIAAARAGTADAVLVAVVGADPAISLALLDGLVAIDPDLTALALVRDADASGHGAALARLGPLATVTTPIDGDELAPRLLAGLERRVLRREVKALRAVVEQRD